MASAPLASSFGSRDNRGMKQADLGLDLTNRKTRKGKFLDEMERVVPWAPPPSGSKATFKTRV